MQNCGMRGAHSVIFIFEIYILHLAFWQSESALKWQNKIEIFVYEIEERKLTYYSGLL